jgi:uncharacterized protein YkwD
MPSRSRALAALAAVAALALASPAGAGATAQTAPCPGADLVPSPENLPQIGAATLCLLNDERAGAGLRPVGEAAALTRPSLAYSAEMVSERFFAHVSPAGSTLVDRLVAAGYIARDGDWAVGENLAWGQGGLATPRSIVIAWMNSPGHRANILTGEFDEIGLGVVMGTPTDPSWGATYTTDFGALPGDGGASRDAASAAPAAVAAAGRTPARKASTRSGAKRCAIPTARGRAAKAGRTRRKGARKPARTTTCGATAKSRAAAKRGSAAR